MIACSPRSFARSARSLVPKFLFLVLVAGMPAPAHAQLSTTSHWGVGVSFTPTWKPTRSELDERRSSRRLEHPALRHPEEVGKADPATILRAQEK